MEHGKNTKVIVLPMGPISQLPIHGEPGIRSRTQPELETQKTGMDGKQMKKETFIIHLIFLTHYERLESVFLRGIFIKRETLLPICTHIPHGYILRMMRENHCVFLLRFWDGERYKNSHSIHLRNILFENILKILLPDV